MYSAFNTVFVIIRRDSERYHTSSLSPFPTGFDFESRSLRFIFRQTLILVSLTDSCVVGDNDER